MHVSHWVVRPGPSIIIEHIRPENGQNDQRYYSWHIKARTDSDAACQKVNFSTSFNCINEFQKAIHFPCIVSFLTFQPGITPTAVHLKALAVYNLSVCFYP